MKHFKVDLKKEFEGLTSKQDVTLECFIAETFERNAPENRTKPAILICPGGGYGFVSHDREGEGIAYKYLSEGFDAFILDYSITPEHFPQQLMEAAAALRYIRLHANEWKTDANRIAVNGYSAGGHLAASLGVFWNDPFVCDALKVKAEEIRPDALVLGYPVITADPSFSHLGSIQNVSGTTDREAPLYKKMSLENHVTEDTPPTFIWHTAEDTCVPVRNSIVFANALAVNKVLFEMHIYPYGWHGLATGSFTTNDLKENHYTYPWMNESVKFLKSLWEK